MKIVGVRGEPIKDSRGDETIKVFVTTDVGIFDASAPNGKSKGKHEAKSYSKSLSGDIESLEKISDYFSSEYIEKFEDLRRVEDIAGGHIGANTLFAFEAAVLKGLASEKNKEIWQLINPNVNQIPRFVGNVVGGGKHSDGNRKLDFQEFLLIPDMGSAKKNFEVLLEKKKDLEELLKKADKKFRKKKNDENAWATSLNEKEVCDVLVPLGISVGVDVAASSFYKRKKYHYKNPPLDRTAEEQAGYLKNLIKNCGLFYIEDPFEEEAFGNFAELLKASPKSLIVGDDLTVTNFKRLEKAIESKSINAIIVKPNQNGSLLAVAEVVGLAKKAGMKIVFSHRSGETNESILADLAFGFGADFLKCGVTGREREVKIKRLIEIEKSLKI